MYRTDQTKGDRFVGASRRQGAFSLSDRGYTGGGRGAFIAVLPDVARQEILFERYLCLLWIRVQHVEPDVALSVTCPQQPRYRGSGGRDRAVLLHRFRFGYGVPRWILATDQKDPAWHVQPPRIAPLGTDVAYIRAYEQKTTYIDLPGPVPPMPQGAIWVFRRVEWDLPEEDAQSAELWDQMYRRHKDDWRVVGKS